MQIITCRVKTVRSYKCMVSSAACISTGLLAVTGLPLLTGCGGSSSSTSSVPVTGEYVTPATVSVAANSTQTFTADTTYFGTAGVTWSVQEGSAGGTITSDGVYTAPTTAGTYHVVATSLTDSSLTATATVSVTAVTASPSPSPSPSTESGSSTVTVN